MESKSTVVEIIDPVLAQKYLDTSLGNRKLSATYLERYVEDMRNHKFHPDSTIEFDWDGHLMNGHHRMKAIIMCGIPQKMTVMRGLDPAYKLYMDQGKTRTAADIENMCFNNIVNAKLVGNATNYLCRYINKRIFSKDKVTADQHRVIRTDFPFLSRAAKEVNELGISAFSIRSPQLTFLYTIIYTKAQSVVPKFIEFMNILGNTTGDDLNVAPVALRNIFLQSTSRSLNNHDRLVMLIESWNAFYNNQPKTSFALGYKSVCINPDGKSQLIANEIGTKLIAPKIEAVDIEN